jgi:hypothetical protein
VRACYAETVRYSGPHTGAFLVAIAAFAAFALVPVFFSSSAEWPAVTVIAVLGVVSLRGVTSPRSPKTAVAGLTSFLAGLGLFIAFAAVAINDYDERPRPWWLMSLWAIAVGLITGGIIALLIAAVRRGRGLGPLRPDR